MSSTRKIFIGILLILTFVLIGFGIYLTNFLQSNTGIDDSDAAGFGNDATKGQYGNVEQMFAKLSCDQLFEIQNSNEENVDFFEDNKEYIKSNLNLELQGITTNGAMSLIPKYCTIKFKDTNKALDIALFAYNKDSKIDNSSQELYNRVNGNLFKNKTIISSGSNYSVDYFFGKDSTKAFTCRLNIFHKQNDFEYLTVSYKWFTNDCSELIEFNKKLADFLAYTISLYMVGIPTS